jgi:integrase
MAWIYRRNDSGLWWIGTRANGRLIQKSTGETEEKKARQQLAALEAMEAAQRAGRLNKEFFEALTGAQLEAVTLFDSLDTWVKETPNRNTQHNYALLAKAMKDGIPHNPLLADVTHEQVRTVMAQIRAEKRPSTANLYLKCCKAFFSRFQGSLRKDPTDGVPAFKDDGTEINREDFTPDQIRAIMGVASPFWRCATALAFYTGLRLSNVAALKVGQLKGNKVVIAHAVKNRKEVSVTLPGSVMEAIRQQIPAGAQLDDYVWPEHAAHVEKGDVTNLSNQFTTILVNAGLRKQAHLTSKGRTGRRNVNPLSFHSLRHSLVSALANAGVNQQVVKKFVGHGSTRVNDLYTHIKQDTLDKAVALLPDITKAEVTK